MTHMAFLVNDDLLGPLIFTFVKLKRRPAITRSVSYDMDSCPFILVIAFPPDKYYAHYSGKGKYSHLLQVKVVYFDVLISGI